MILKLNKIGLIICLFLIPSAKSAERLFLYQGTFSRVINIKDLSEFKNSGKASPKLNNLIKITNQNEKNLYKVLSYEIDIPLRGSSKLMNSKIGEVFLSRLSKIIYPNKISNKNIGTKAIRSGILLGSYKNNQKINLIEFFKAYPNRDVAIDLKALRKALKKAESLKELIEFFSDSPFKKLKDGSSRI
tara:strand:- start:4604 stop:5167 length:564 start_codon:yes stop_codon:yes gene_type:complete